MSSLSFRGSSNPGVENFQANQLFKRASRTRISKRARTMIRTLKSSLWRSKFRQIVTKLEQMNSNSIVSLFSISPYCKILCVLWLAVIWYGERSYVKTSIAKCNWSKWESSGDSGPLRLSTSNGRRPDHVALVADPQLIDENTYPGRPKVLLNITKFLVDLYLRRNWVYFNRILDPDANLFLGDLFDGGREWNDRTWYKEYDRWNKIFTKPPLKRTIMSLPGNHDIGYGNTIVPRALDRFQSFFGEASSSWDIGNHTFIFLDAISLLNDANETIYNAPKQFIESLPPNPDRPRILLTHVPLYRPPGYTCGSLRESKKALPYVYGYQYQTLVTPEITDYLLTSIKPVAIFSGDDHDACHVIHPYSINGIEHHADEFTVKSFSMAMGIAFPGIQLISLGNDLASSSAAPSYKTHICLMPSPFYAFKLYGLLALISAFILVLFIFYPRHVPKYLTRLQSTTIRHVAPSSPTQLPLHEDDYVFVEEEEKKHKIPVPNKQIQWLLLFKEAFFIVATAVSFFSLLVWSIYR